MRRIGATFLRYIIVAVLAYLVDIGVFSLLYYTRLADITVANLTGKVATAIFGFFAHRTVTFQLTGNRGMAKEAIKYFGLAFLYAPFITGLLLLLLPFFSSATLAKIVADTIGVIVTFALAKLFVFQKRPDGLDLPRS